MTSPAALAGISRGAEAYAIFLLMSCSPLGAFSDDAVCWRAFTMELGFNRSTRSLRRGPNILNGREMLSGSPSPSRLSGPYSPRFRGGLRDLPLTGDHSLICATGAGVRTWSCLCC